MPRSRPLNRAKLIYELCRTHGLGWVAYRLRNAIDHKIGRVERKYPITTWDAVDVESSLANDWQSHCGTFLFAPENRAAYKPILEQFDDESIDWADRVQAIASGKLSYFSNEPAQVGFPPKWNDNLLQRKPGPPLVHFSKINEFGCGDVKCIWEPNRFGFAYELVRAFWRTGDEYAAEVFWLAAEDWLEHNPPNRGINWKCGQESTFRAIAWCFALWGFANCRATTPVRILIAIKLMRATGQRIEAHLGYALSQRNNHGISETMGLFTIGLLFPFFPESTRWTAMGRKHLESQSRHLIYDDGGFAQHSVNYHRVMLDDLLYAIRIGELNNTPLSDKLYQQAKRAGRWLTNLTESQQGRVPRLGQDDGALILPLTNSSYDDYRPSSQSASAFLETQPLPWSDGPWDEHALWLVGPEALNRERCCEPAEAHEDDIAMRASGLYVLQFGDLRASLRAAHYNHRPSQLDQLHIDVWWKGINIALDPGTYCYNADGSWAGIPLSKTAAHNTVMVQGDEQAEQAGSRFIFLPWPQVRVAAFDQWRRDHKHDYEHAIIETIGPDPQHHRQLIRLGEELLIVLDTLDLPGSARPSTLHWHLADALHIFDPDAGKLTLNYTPGTFGVALGTLNEPLTIQLDRAVAGSHVGWYAPRYMKTEPALWLTASAPSGKARLFTLFAPNQIESQATAQGLQIQVAGKNLNLNADDWPGQGKDPLATLNRLAQQWST